jgi:CMP-N-acetylneuraminic acid synthetase
MPKSKNKIVAMIPAKKSSQRLPNKNLALLDGKPLVYYAIDNAKQAAIFDRIVLNSDDERFSNIAAENGIEFYLRSAALGGSKTKTDEAMEDFMQNNPADITAWISPIAPLQTGEEIQRVIEYFCDNDLDSLITVKEEQVHCLLNGKPINYREDEIFAQTQDIVPVQRHVYSVMIWRNHVFLETYKKKGYAVLCGKVGYYPVSKLSSLIIKTEEDLRLIEYILTGKRIRKDYTIEYAK